MRIDLTSDGCRLCLGMSACFAIHGGLRQSFAGVALASSVWLYDVGAEVRDVGHSHEQFYKSGTATISSLMNVACPEWALCQFLPAQFPYSYSAKSQIHRTSP